MYESHIEYMYIHVSHMYGICTCACFKIILYEYMYIYYDVHQNTSEADPGFQQGGAGWHAVGLILMGEGGGRAILA